MGYLDETYHLEFDGHRRFYVMAAVVVLEQDRDFDIDAINADLAELRAPASI